MDENKEILASEQDVEEVTESVTELLEKNDETSAETTEELSDETTDDTEETDTLEIQNTPKKKRLLQTPIIIAVVIVAVAAIALIVFKCFFDTSVVGSWAEIIETNESTSDEAAAAEQYYIFEGDGKMLLKTGTMTWVGSYEPSVTKDGEKQLTIMINGSPSIFGYEVKGNIFTGRTLTLSTDYGQSVDLSSTSVKTPELKIDKDFKPNDKLIGTWTYDSGISQMSYTFNKDGTVKVNQADMLYVDGTYTYTDNLIQVTYYISSEVTMDLSYAVEEDGIKINDILFKKADSENKTAETTVAATEAE